MVRWEGGHLLREVRHVEATALLRDVLERAGSNELSKRGAALDTRNAQTRRARRKS